MTTERVLIDALAARFVLRPESLDVVVGSNLFGDILTDLGGAICGSLGMAASGNINPERDYPSMFEPIHGSAFDIMGKGFANPVGTFWSVVMLLEHLGETAAAEHVMKAPGVCRFLCHRMGTFGFWASVSRKAPRSFAPSGRRPPGSSCQAIQGASPGQSSLLQEALAWIIADCRFLIAD